MKEMNCVLMSPRMNSRNTIKASLSTFMQQPCSSRSLSTPVECSETYADESSSNSSEKQTTEKEMALKEKNIKFVEVSIYIYIYL